MSVEQRLGYRFIRPEVLEQALTHCSAGAPNNERLEFLGDALLGALIAARLYACYPDAGEGELTRLRARLVNRAALAAIAREIGLGAELRLGAGERKSGGAERESILANALEAVIGAAYVDAGLPACMAIIDACFDSRIAQAGLLLRKDPKTELQEWLQARGAPLPVYRLLAQPDTDAQAQPDFIVECDATGLPQPAPGRGGTRRGAEQAAAQAVLEYLLLRNPT